MLPLLKQSLCILLAAIAITFAISIWSTAFADTKRGIGTGTRYSTSTEVTVAIDDVQGATFRYRQIFLEWPMPYSRHRPLSHASEFTLDFTPSDPLGIPGVSTDAEGDAIRGNLHQFIIPDGFEDFHEPSLHIAHGWPWLAFEAHVLWLSPKSVNVKSMDDLVLHVESGTLWKHATGSANVLDIRVLAYKPLWPGFLANTAVFAAGLVLIGLLARSFLHLRRYRKGLCPRCAYDREFSYVVPCPECGLATTAVPARS